MMSDLQTPVECPCFEIKFSCVKGNVWNVHSFLEISVMVFLATVSTEILGTSK